MATEKKLAPQVFQSMVIMVGFARSNLKLADHFFCRCPRQMHSLSVVNPTEIAQPSSARL